jgi:hypothetical protein
MAKSHLRLGDTEAVAVAHEDHDGVPVAPTVAVCGGQQAFHFALGPILAGAQVGVWRTPACPCDVRFSDQPTVPNVIAETICRYACSF